METDPRPIISSESRVPRSYPRAWITKVARASCGLSAAPIVRPADLAEIVYVPCESGLPFTAPLGILDAPVKIPAK